MTPFDPFEPDELVLPACVATVARLQGVLDGELPSSALDADSHPASCVACRERVAAARLLVSILAVPAEPMAMPRLTDRILDAVHADRRTRQRGRVFAYTGGLTVAAAVLIAVWWNWPQSHPAETPEIAHVPSIVKPTPANPDPEPAPAPRAIRIDDELSKSVQALRDAPRTLTEPASAAPMLLSKVTDALSFSPMPDEEMESPATALTDIPDAARVGLEPVTGTAQKAFDRLLHDFGGLQGHAKPKS